MRTVVAISGLLYCSATILAATTATSAEGGGSLQALLERYSQKARHAIPVNTIPENLKSNVTDEHASKEVEPVKVKPSAAVAEAEPKEDRLVKRVRTKEEQRKRWIWATKIIQDGDAAPSIGQNANLLGDSTVLLTTPGATLAAPTFAAPATSSTAAVKGAKQKSAGAAQHLKKKGMSHDRQHDGKRWIMGPTIIQDGDLDAPPIGSNVNQFSGAPKAATPKATLVAPTFPPRVVAFSAAHPSPSTSADILRAAAASGRHRSDSQDEDAYDADAARQVVSAVAASANEIMSSRLPRVKTASTSTRPSRFLRTSPSPSPVAVVNARMQFSTVMPARMNAESGKLRVAATAVDEDEEAEQDEEDDAYTVEYSSFEVEADVIEVDEAEEEAIVSDLAEMLASKSKQSSRSSKQDDVDGDVVESEEADYDGFDY